MSSLIGVRVVDLNRTDIPKEKWDETVRAYYLEPEIEEKLEYVPDTYRGNAATRPPYKFGWAWNEPKGIKDWSNRYGYTFVTIEDGYWPRGSDIEIDGSGHFVCGDVVFMKVTNERWLRRYKENHDAAIAQQKKSRQDFQREVSEVKGAKIDEIWIEEKTGF